MENRCEALCEALAQSVVERNFKDAHGLFAPWLKASVSPDDIERLVSEAGEGLPPARAWTLDEGFLEVEDLGIAPKEITRNNYRGWLCIQFNPGAAIAEDAHASFDLWLAAVEHDGNYYVGHLEAAEAD